MYMKEPKQIAAEHLAATLEHNLATLNLIATGGAYIILQKYSGVDKIKPVTDTDIICRVLAAHNPDEKIVTLDDMPLGTQYYIVELSKPDLDAVKYSIDQTIGKAAQTVKGESTAPLLINFNPAFNARTTS